MIELAQLDPARLAGVRAVFSDIDDTISTGGKITAAAYAALWRLHEALKKAK